MNQRHHAPRFLCIISGLILVSCSLLAQRPIQKRVTQPDGWQIVSWSYPKKNYSSTYRDIFRFGLYDSARSSFLLEMNFDYLGYSKQPNKYIVRDTTGLRYALYDAKQRQFLTPFVYNSIGMFNEGISVVTFYDSTAKGVRSSALYPDGKRASFVYDLLSEGFFGRMRFKQNGRWGLLKTDGTVVRPAEFELMQPISQGMLAVRYEENRLMGYIDIDGKEVIPPSYEFAESFMRERAVVYTKKTSWKFTQGPGNTDLAGVINPRGEFVIPPIFTAIENPPGTRSIYIVTNTDKKKGIYDFNGKLLHDFNITYLGTWVAGRSQVSLVGGNKNGLMDTLGRWIVPPQYDIVNSPMGQYVSAFSKFRHDVFELTGKKLFTVDSASRLVLGAKHVLALLKKKSATIYDYNGKVIRTIEQPGLNEFGTDFSTGASKDSVYVAYSNLITVHDIKTKKQTYITDAIEVSGYLDNLLLVKNNLGYLWMDLQGKRLSNKHYFLTELFNEGIALAREYQYGNQIKLINRAGKELATLNAEALSSFSQGLVLVKTPNTRIISAVDSLGKVRWMVDSAQGASHLGNGLVSIQTLRNKYALYTAAGKRVTDSLFDQLGEANNGVIGFKRNGRFGFINYEGKVVIEPTYTGASNANGKMIVVKKGTEVIIINTQGKPLNDSTYTDGRTPLEEGLAPVARDKKWGLVNAAGKTIVPCVYEDITWAAANRIFVKRGKEWWLTDYSGKPIGKLPFETAERFNEGYSRVFYKNKMGIIDMQGNWVIQPDYKNLTVVRNQKVVSFEQSGGKKWAIKN